MSVVGEKQTSRRGPSNFHKLLYLHHRAAFPATRQTTTHSSMDMVHIVGVVSVWAAWTGGEGKDVSDSRTHKTF